MRKIENIEDLLERKNKHPEKVLGLYGCDRFSDYIIESVKMSGYDGEIIYIPQSEINSLDLNDNVHTEYVGNLRVSSVFKHYNKGFKLVSK